MSTPEPELDRLSQALNIARRVGLTTNTRNSLQLPECIEERLNVRRILDEGIDILDERLVELRTFRNSLAPIFLLPDELLSLIFYQCALLSGAWSHGGWTKVLFVCRKWRDVAMGDGRLWSYIDVGTIGDREGRRVREWVRRSKGHPLSWDIFSAGNQRPRPWVFTKDIHRVRTLILMGILGEVNRFFDGVEEMVGLENIELKSFYDPSTGEDAKTWQVPAFIVEGGAPRLRSILFSGMGFAKPNDWDVLVNLTHLSLQHRPDPLPAAMQLPSFFELADFLKRSPQLKTLSLSDYIDPASAQGDISDHRASIILCDLQSIDLHMPVHLVTAILESVVVPPSCSMNLVTLVISVSTLNHDLSRLLVPLRLHLRHARAPILRSMRLESCRDIDISAYTESTCPRKHYTQKSHVSLKTQGPATQSKLRKVLTKIMHAFPLHTVEYFDASHIFIQGQLSPKSWLTLFGLLPIPMTIEIGVNYAMLDMLGALMEAMRKGLRALPGGGRMRRRTPLRLRLSRLILQASHHPESYDEGPVPEQQRQLYEDLMLLLAQYRDLDAPSKAGGICVGALEVGDMHKRFCQAHITHSFLHVYNVADRLSLLVGELFIDGRLWDLSDLVKAQTELRVLKRKLKDAGVDVDI